MSITWTHSVFFFYFPLPPFLPSFLPSFLPFCGGGSIRHKECLIDFWYCIFISMKQHPYQTVPGQVLFILFLKGKTTVLGSFDVDSGDSRTPGLHALSSACGGPRMVRAPTLTVVCFCPFVSDFIVRKCQGSGPHICRRSLTLRWAEQHQVHHTHSLPLRSSPASGIWTKNRITACL